MTDGNPKMEFRVCLGSAKMDLMQKLAKNEEKICSTYFLYIAFQTTDFGYYLTSLVSRKGMRVPPNREVNRPVCSDLKTSKLLSNYGIYPIRRRSDLAWHTFSSVTWVERTSSHKLLGNGANFRGFGSRKMHSQKNIYSRSSITAAYR